MYLIKSLDELKDVCSEVLDNLEKLGDDISEFLDALNVKSVGDLIAKLLLASVSDAEVVECKYCDEVDEELIEDDELRMLAQFIESEIEENLDFLPSCKVLMEVIESGKRRSI